MLFTCAFVLLPSNNHLGWLTGDIDSRLILQPSETMTSHASISVLEDSSSSPPFEGPEKLLEIWFAASSPSLDIENGSSSSSRDAGLRVVPRRVWEEMLDLVRCKVLSVIEGEQVDAYLLRWAWAARHE